MWDLSFISEEDFTNHVKSTIENMVKSCNQLTSSTLIRILSIRSSSSLTKRCTRRRGTRLLVTKYFGSATNRTTTILVIFIKAFFNICQTVTCLPTAMRAVGM